MSVRGERLRNIVFQGPTGVSGFYNDMDPRLMLRGRSDVVPCSVRASVLFQGKS